VSWFARWFRRDDPDRDLADEIRFHLDQETSLRIDRGTGPDEARQGARRVFGNVLLVAETTRQMWGWTPMTLFDDLTHAYRRLRARPATAFMAAAMLALGIGLATSMFTLVDALVLRPAPFREPDRLVRLSLLSGHNGRRVVSADVLSTWRTSPVFAAVEGTTSATSILDTDTGPLVIASARVTPGIFALLGVRPSRGQAFDRTDGRTGSDDRVLLSEDVWRTAFGADPGVLGRLVTIDGTLARVVGLMPSGFRFPDWNTVIWQPIDYTAPPPALVGSQAVPFVRLAPGVPLADALKVAADLGRRADATITSDTAVRTRALAGTALDPYYAHAVPLLCGGVVLVFLVLCANVASLLLARLAARQAEFRMCTALGASRGRLVRQALFEHVLLGFGGAVFGIGLAWLLLSLARGFLPTAFLVRTLHPVELDGRALGVAMAAGLLAALAAGVLPAWMGTRSDRAATLAAGERGGTENRAARVLTRSLLVAEVALASTLLVVAILLVRSFINLASVDPGLKTDGVLTTWLVLPANNFADRPSRLTITATLEDAIRHLPGIDRVALTGGLPPEGYTTFIDDEWQADDPGAKPTEIPIVTNYYVGPEFFELYGIPLLGGRTFQPGEDPNDVVLGERLAALLWPRQNPVGRFFHQGKDEYHVVGLAHEIRLPSVDANYRDAPQFYQPFVAGSSDVYMNLRCAGRCPDEAVIRRRIFTTVSGANIVSFGALSEAYREELARPRGAVALGSTFAAIAVLAAAGGLFSVLTYAVGRRRREFGIRVALGASPTQIRRQVLLDGANVTALGVGIGIAASVALARVVASLEYGVTSFDPLTYGLVLGLLATTTLVASWRPARRAMRVDPAELLRDE
jgi:putative ABC transport system permease protein